MNEAEAPGEDKDKGVPDQIPEENPPNNISDNNNEDQRLCLQKQQQQLYINTIHPSWSMQLQFPTGPPMYDQAANVQVQASSPSMSVGPGNPALQLQYYEAQMRDHAAAYASAAASAAMTAAQIAGAIASSNGAYHLHQQQPQPHAQQNIVPMSPMHFPESPQLYQPSNPMHQNFGPPLYQHQSWIHPSSQQPSQGYDNTSPVDQAQEPSPSSEGNSNNTNCHQRRRKRQQHVSSSNFHGSKSDLRHDYHDANNRECDESNDACGTSAVNGNGTGTGTGANRLQQGQQKRGRRRRRFWNDAGSSDSGDPSYNQYSSNNIDRSTRTMAKATSSSSDGGSASWITKKKQRQPNDDSLLGKTGVSALYEWCMKRRTTPTFSMAPSANDNNNNNKKDTENSENETQQPEQAYMETQQQHVPKDEEGKRRRLELEHDFFETTVSIDGIEMGTGRGRTKTSAKHEASRRALLTLLPGVVFDEDSGILIRLPGNYSQGTSHGQMQQQKIAAITSMEDLAPNLAKQLAIGHSNDDEKNMEHRKQRERNTSDELTARDSRKRQKWPHVYPGTSTTSDDEDENSYYASRGAYVCSSLLHAMVQIDERLTEPPEFTYQVSAITNEAGGQHSKLKRKAGVPINATSTAIPRGSFQCTGILKLQINLNSLCSKDDDAPVDAFDETPQPRDCYRLLRSSGVGGTKREARHTAAAKLLAMLFPECDGMADVKQAAEAAREKYAASRALKQQSKREALFTGSSRSKNNFFSPIHSNDSVARNLMFRRVLANTPVVPTIMKHDFFHVLGGLSPKSSYAEDSSGYRYKGNGIGTLKETGLVRQLSRQQQLEEKIECALQKLNEHDDEGRSLPEELTADDVGRTVLRRARVDDVFLVEKLFRTKTAPTACACDSSPLFETILDSDKEASSMSMQLWSSSTIVLLLCRAIAPHEDPPLGCAVLTVGFSLQKGKTLRIAQIASKSHQPRERFIETLSVFAKNMECSLITITSPLKSSFATLDKGGVQRLLDPQWDSREYPLRQDGSQKSKTIPDDIDLPPPREESLVKPSLQAVEEEGEGVEESDSSSPNDEKEKRREKPSKRSRFE
jgi:hypothetical protein